MQDRNFIFVKGKAIVILQRALLLENLTFYGDFLRAINAKTSSTKGRGIFVIPGVILLTLLVIIQP